jgi:hypothetical protein
MDRVIRTQVIRILIVYMLMLGICVWQNHFIMIGIESNPYLNLTIIGVFVIGTFIGLMEMVGSVGGIIGGLARSDNSSPDAIKQLIRDLEAPLVGMATGFSASLFGLGGSLILGLMARFTTQAANAVRDELEGWLAGISQLAENEEVHAKGSSVATVSGPSSTELVHFAGMAVAVMGGVRRTNLALTRAADSIRLLADRQVEHSQLLTDVCSQVEQVAGQQSEVRYALMRTTAMQADISGLRGDVARAAEQIESRVSGGLTRVGEAVAGGTAGVMAAVGELTVRQADSLSQTLEVGRRVEDSARRLELQGQRLADVQTRGFETVAGEITVLHHSIGEIGRGLAASDAAHGRARDHVESSFSRLQTLFTEASAQNRIGLQAVEAGLASIDQGMAKGFDGQALAVQGVGRELGALSHRMSDVIALIDRDLTARSEEGAQRSLAQNQALERVAAHQAEIGKVLRILAGSLNTDPSALANGIKDAIGEGFQQVASSLDGTYGVLGQSLDRLATGQDAIAKAVERSAGGAALTAELREIGRSLERGIVSGLGEVTQTFENTFGAYSELVRSAQLDLKSEHGPLVEADERLPTEPTGDDALGMASHLDELRRMASLRSAGASGKK